MDWHTQSVPQIELSTLREVCSDARYQICPPSIRCRKLRWTLSMKFLSILRVQRHVPNRMYILIHRVARHWPSVWMAGRCARAPITSEHDDDGDRTTQKKTNSSNSSSIKIYLSLCFGQFRPNRGKKRASISSDDFVCRAGGTEQVWLDIEAVFFLLDKNSPAMHRSGDSPLDVETKKSSERKRGREKSHS